jgi:Zn ribbon nucleic-acid-binding protein
MPEKHTLDSFIFKSNIIHNNFYDYSESVYIGSKKKLTIICPKHGKFEQQAYDHINGRGCIKCGFEKTTNLKRLTKEKFVKRANAIHNNKYDYSLVNYKNNGILITIKCNLGHIFEQTPGSHLNGHGCSKCAGNKIITTNQYIERAKEVHKDAFDYSRAKYINSNTKLEVICKNKHILYIRPHDHLRGTGCSICGGNKKLTTDQFIESAKKAHGNLFDYSKSNYIGRANKIEIICKIHGSFFQSPYSHISGHGCPKCFCFSSKKEIKWLNSLNIPNLERNKHLKINGRRFMFDGFDPATNTIYEFNGDFWHGNPNVYKLEDVNYMNGKTFGQLYNKTLDKEKFLKSNGYNVISMWEKDFDLL